ncbi:MAG: sigma-54-dependent Fis family transcriptional regulator [Candidatus Hydrogenedentes bacterium]|nr:sigma-54-dependent Fis family transcriptional regulator [Candidatus Hydrogenedentota bacterium]
MLIRLVLAIKDKRLEEYLKRRFELGDVRIESHGHLSLPWQRVMRSCGDIMVISESLIPGNTETGIIMLNDLPETPTTVILQESSSSEEQARFVAAGADVVLNSRIPRESLAAAIETVLESRRQFMAGRHGKKGVSPRMADFALKSETMRVFVEEVRQVMSSSSPLLLLGETGVGKEHLAKAIHAESARSGGPFVAVNAAGLPEQLLESELFGHMEGAFTGAVRTRRGAFELAHRGTFFLDEIGEMPYHLQAKLLRALQDYEIRPVGSEDPILVDVRVIAATNHDLEEEILQNRFRKDLYYRLSVITLTLPPLRERKEDIPELALRFLEHYRVRVGRSIAGISEAAMEALCSYDWPGNTRELINIIERATILCRGNKITLEDLPQAFLERESRAPRPAASAFDGSNWTGMSLHDVKQEVMGQVERAYLEAVLRDCRGRVGEAAKRAGIHPRGLYNKMKQLGLRKEDFKQ